MLSTIVAHTNELNRHRTIAAFRRTRGTGTQLVVRVSSARLESALHLSDETFLAALSQDRFDNTISVRGCSSNTCSRVGAQALPFTHSNLWLRFSCAGSTNRRRTHWSTKTNTSIVSIVAELFFRSCCFSTSTHTPTHRAALAHCALPASSSLN